MMSADSPDRCGLDKDHGRFVGRDLLTAKLKAAGNAQMAIRLFKATGKNLPEAGNIGNQQ